MTDEFRRLLHIKIRREVRHLIYGDSCFRRVHGEKESMRHIRLLAARRAIELYRDLNPLPNGHLSGAECYGKFLEEGLLGSIEGAVDDALR